MANLVSSFSEENSDNIRSWEAPVVEGPITGQHDVPGKPPTAGEMQSLQKEAYREAYEQGREEGLKSGYDEGMQQAQAKLNAQIVTFQNLMLQLSGPLSSLDDELEQSIVVLTTQIARHLVRREMRLEPGEIVAVVREAVNILPVSALRPRIFLNPSDASVVRNALNLSDDESSWKIEEDPTMTRGDCRVETDSSLIDASVDARLSAVAAKLLGGERDTDSND